MSKKNKKNTKKESVKSKKSEKKTKKTIIQTKTKTPKEVKVFKVEENIVVNSKHGHLDVLSLEEEKERKEEGTVKEIPLPFLEGKDEIHNSLADVLETISEMEEKEVTRLSSKGSAKEEKPKTKYLFYSVQDVDDNDFIIDTTTDPCYSDIQEAQDALSDKEDGCVWMITAIKVLRLGKTVQKVA